ncbi:universal stress protein E [Sinobacterium caligoides]|uniref:Universal stress protein E n=1 Tax=Sinobacterium caligoides TaxID=933926 RepID=A0A3N2DRP4_9GAMM|nr:universal stress protein [Sinobacterium caligoides]ROS01975.1 universal stress protein E [Sinobacterium caligoides]
MNPEKENKIFVVVDPSQERHFALERAIITASFREPRAALHILVAVDAEHTDTTIKNNNLFRTTDWFYQLAKPVEEAGIEFDVEFCWSGDWYGSIIKASESSNSNLILLPLMHRPSDSLWVNESIWKLLRTSALPVLMVQPGAEMRRKTILAAVNFQGRKEKYRSLNDDIIYRGRWMAEKYDAELHIVNAYKDSLSYPDRSALARETGVNSNHIHVVNGTPEDVIATMSKELQADVTIVGTLKRSNSWRGNTSEKVISRLQGDILTLN